MTDGQAKELYQVFWYKYSDRSSTSCITGSVDVLMLDFKPPCCECSITAPEDVPLTETVCRCSLCGRHHWLECLQHACARRRLKLPLRNKGKNEFWSCKECRQRFKCDEVANSWTQIIIQLLCDVSVTPPHASPQDTPPPTDVTGPATGLRCRSRGGRGRGGPRQATPENARHGGRAAGGGENARHDGRAAVGGGVEALPGDDSPDCILDEKYKYLIRPSLLIFTFTPMTPRARLWEKNVAWMRTNWYFGMKRSFLD